MSCDTLVTGRPGHCRGAVHAGPQRLSPASQGVVLARLGHVGLDRYREGVNTDHAVPQYHVLPKDDAEAVVDIMRAAAGLPPLYDKHGDEGS